FCQAHNCERLLDNLWQHFQYESMLHRLLISIINKVPIKEDICDIEAFIKERYESYLLEEASLVVDIFYSLEICHSVAYNILLKGNRNFAKAA
ncbi:MAG: hypothetical protein ACOYJ1_15965, partial [Peptococcales bacterium]